jgi:hypothetical protein
VGIERRRNTMAKYSAEAMQGASVEALGWMAGRWRGTYGPNMEPIEEHWTAPEGGMLLAMFRWVRDGKVWLTELVSIEEEPDAVVLRIKHFSPGMQGWEEKGESVTFHLVELGEGRAVFVKRGGEKPLWMTYHQPDPNTLIAYFEREDADRDPDSDFVYKRF